MGDILTPGNIVVAVVVLVAVVVGVRRAVRGVTTGASCCTDGTARPRTKRAAPLDTDESHYPYRVELLIGGMSCENCARTVEGALNGVGDTWARVDLAEKCALVLSKREPDRETLEEAVKRAGYYVMKL